MRATSPRVAWTAAVVLVASCGASQSTPPALGALAEPRPSEVDVVVFLVGDAGQATTDHSPLLRRLRDEVETWATELRDSSVVVLFLGDNVYPAGVHLPEHPDFARDSARLWSQVWTVDGPEARARGARGVFLAGNHDWGNHRGTAGRARIENEGRLLAEFADGGSLVRLEPAAGMPGPWVMDLGSTARIAAIDTQWWLQAGEDPGRDGMLRGLDSALVGAGPRHVVLAAHHPFSSGGPHGRGPKSPLNPAWLLHRTGAAVQDLNSGPYRALRSGLSDVFDRVGAPLVFAAGHDHSLQVIQGSGPGEPGWTLVSGAGSKLSDVGGTPGTRWQASQPGYMRLVFLASGSVELFVTASSSEAGICPGEGEPLETCMAEGLRSFVTTYSGRLR